MDYKQALCKEIKKTLNIDVTKLIETPPKQELGDYSLPCFTLAKNPVQFAQETTKKLAYIKFISEIKSVGPFINFYLDKNQYATTLKEITEDYGKGNKQTDKVMIEYSAPNIFKAFHLGHLRNTTLGESLTRIMKYDGYEVIQANYMNDKGSHIAKWIWCYNKYHNTEQPPKNNVESWMAKIYAESYEKSKENKKANEEIVKINQLVKEGKDKEIMSLIKKGTDWSVKGFNQIYQILQANFDVVFWESPLEKDANRIVSALLKKSIATKSEGAIILDYEKYGLEKTVIQRSDGTNLYLTSDFALAEKKFKEYEINKSIYVVGSEQKLHFKQLFKTLELMGFKQANNCFHLSYELVRFPDRKMSSRSGDNILFMDFFEEIKKLTRLEVDARHPEWNDTKKNMISENIAVAAIKFGMLKQDSNKIIIFDQNKEISFEGETGPYLQYTHARACSILKKKKFSESNYELLNSEKEFLLIKKLNEFRTIVQKASSDYKPSYLATYLIELAQEFNSFYHSNQVIQIEDELSNARLVLVDKVRIIISKGLYLLGINAPEQM